MELYQLRMFASVAELGSLKQAAARLNVSQPAASAQIKSVEDEFGVALFERRPNGLALTSAGTRLLPLVQRLLATARDIETQAKRLRGQLAGKIRFATIFDASLMRLGEIMSLMVARYPLLEIDVRHCNSRSVVASVSAGEVDAGVALGKRERLPGLHAIVLRKLRYRIVAPSSWPETMRRAGWDEIASSPWISTPEQGSHYEMTSDLFARHSITPPKVINADSETVIGSLVAAGLGLSLMREDLAIAAQANGSILVLDRGHAETLLRFLYQDSRAEDPTILALTAVLREVWSDDLRGQLIAVDSAALPPVQSGPLHPSSRQK